MALNIETFKDSDALTADFANRIADILRAAIKERGRASLVVSGGRTPLPLFKALSETRLSWQSVDVTLADERWVDENDEASNTRLVKQHLLTGFAESANFVPLKSEHASPEEGLKEAESAIASMARPFDVLILGMGEDGHTASLFPCSDEISDGLDLNSGKTCIAVSPKTAPHKRISLTLPALLDSHNIFLHLTGDTKRDVLTQALAQADELSKPIVAVVNRAPVTLMWAP